MSQPPQTPAVPRIEIRLFGSPQWVEAGQARPLIDRAAQIFGVLAMSEGGVLRRAHVAETLWGDTDTGLTNLRQALSRLKRAHPSLMDLILADSATLTLRVSACDIDILRLKSPSEDLVLPQGEFLEGTDRPSEDFEDWLRAARNTLQQQRRRIAQTALERALRYGRCDLSEFEALAEQLRAFDDGTDNVEATIKAAARHAGLRPAQTISQTEDAPARAEPPRLAMLRPVADLRLPIPIERFIEDVTDRLSRFRSFATLAPFSSFGIRADDIPASAERMNLAYVAETRVIGTADSPHLAMRLTSTRDARIVWATELPLAPEALLDSGRRMAQTLAETLADQVESDLAGQERALGTPGAYLHFLAGRTQQMRGDLPALRRARNSFRAALRQDPGFAVARARIAETLVIEWILRGGTDGELLADAFEQASKARDHDSGAAEAHWILGSTQLYRREYDRVERHFETAQMLAPHSADLILNYADAMSHLDASAKAETLFRKALDLNPTPPDRYWWFGASIALSNGDFTTAAQRCDWIASDEVAVGMRTTCYALSGQSQKAGIWAQRMREVLPGISIDELVSLMPGPRTGDLQRNYKEGLQIAGLK